MTNYEKIQRNKEEAVKAIITMMDEFSCTREGEERFLACIPGTSDCYNCIKEWLESRCEEK